jgi:hypothetical protein
MGSNSIFSQREKRRSDNDYQLSEHLSALKHKYIVYVLHIGKEIITFVSYNLFTIKEGILRSAEQT